MTQESDNRAEEVAEDFEHKRHRLHHKIKVRAFELHEEAVKTNSVDFGPWFYWFWAEWEFGIIHTQPIPPPVE